MNIYTYILIAILTIASIALLYGLYKTKKRFISFWSSAIYGVIAFVLVSLSGNFTGVYIGINLYSLICAAVLGIPGVILMLLINIT